LEIFKITCVVVLESTTMAVKGLPCSKSVVPKMVSQYPRGVEIRWWRFFNSVGKWSPNPNSSPYSLQTWTCFHPDWLWIDTRWLL